MYPSGDFKADGSAKAGCLRDRLNETSVFLGKLVLCFRYVTEGGHFRQSGHYLFRGGRVLGVSLEGEEGAIGAPPSFSIALEHSQGWKSRCALVWSAPWLGSKISKELLNCWPSVWFGFARGSLAWYRRSPAASLCAQNTNRAGCARGLKDQACHVGLNKYVFLSVFFCAAPQKLGSAAQYLSQEKHDDVLVNSGDVSFFRGVERRCVYALKGHMQGKTFWSGEPQICRGNFGCSFPPGVFFAGHIIAVYLDEVRLYFAI